MSRPNTTASNEDVESDVPDTGDAIPDLGNGVDMEAFSQILEMDDDGDRSFSKSLFADFIAQAKETFGKIEGSLAAGDLKALSEEGHFLKGSSATLGLSKVRDSCEKIQRYGKKENADGSPEPNAELCLQRIRDTLVVLRADYDDVAKELKRFYNIHEDTNEDEDDSEAESAENDTSSNKDATKDSGKT